MVSWYYTKVFQADCKGWMGCEVSRACCLQEGAWELPGAEGICTQSSKFSAPLVSWSCYLICTATLTTLPTCPFSYNASPWGSGSTGRERLRKAMGRTRSLMNGSKSLMLLILSGLHIKKINCLYIYFPASLTWTTTKLHAP